MAEQFYTIPTAIGKAKIANSIALGAKVNLKTMKIGDSNGIYYNPSESQTDLVHTVYSCEINSVEIDESNSNWINVVCAIPADVGDFFIREVGIFDDNNDLIAIGKYPETYKPLASNGSTKELYIKMTFEVTNVSSVTLKIDPTVILATKNDINILTNSIAKLTTQMSESVKFNGCYLENTFIKLYGTKEDVILLFGGDSVTWGKTNNNYTGCYVYKVALEFATRFPKSKIIYAEARDEYASKFPHPVTNYDEYIIQEGTERTITIVNSGIAGESLLYWFKRKDNFIHYNSKVIDAFFIMIGLNDSDDATTNSYRYLPVDEYELGLDSIVKQIKDNGIDVVIQSCHWMGTTAESRIITYIDSQKRVATANDVMFIDHKSVWDEHWVQGTSNLGQDSWMLSTDGLHPTSDGNTAISNKIIKDVFSFYKKKGENISRISNTIEKNSGRGLRYTGTWTDVAITGGDSISSYNYKKISSTGKVYCHATGKKVYLICRKVKGTSKINVNFNNEKTTELDLSTSYPIDSTTYGNSDILCLQYVRIPIYDGENANHYYEFNWSAGDFYFYGIESINEYGSVVVTDFQETFNDIISQEILIMKKGV